MTPALLRARRQSPIGVFAAAGPYLEAAGITNGKGTRVALERHKSSAGDHIWVWLEASNGWWFRLEHDDDGANRLSCRAVDLVRVLAIETADDLTTGGGSWSLLGNSGAGETAAYWCGRAIQASTGDGRYVETTIDFQDGEDLWILFSQQATGGRARVDIDGDQTLVNVLTDLGDGYKAFDTYGATTDNGRWVLAATGLVGSHTVRITNLGDMHPSSTNDNVRVEGICRTAAPGDTGTMPPAWTQGEAVLSGQERMNDGKFYRATGSGTCGATAPTHTSGTASDGAVTWRNFTISSYQWHRVKTTYASEMEFALNVEISGLAEDFGGATHGGGVVSARTILLDGAAWSESGDYHAADVGALITISESVGWAHTNDASLATVSFGRNFQAGLAAFSAPVDWTTASADVLWMYVGMLPFLGWDNIYDENAFATYRLGDGTEYNLADFANITSASSPADAQGQVYSAGVYGTLREVKALRVLEVPPAAVDYFSITNAGHAAKLNITGTDYGDNEDWTAKGYISYVYSAANPLAVSNGDRTVLQSNHFFYAEDP